MTGAAVVPQIRFYVPDMEASAIKHNGENAKGRGNPE